MSDISLLKISENTLIKRVCLPILGKCEVEMSKETQKETKYIGNGEFKKSVKK